MSIMDSVSPKEFVDRVSKLIVLMPDIYRRTAEITSSGTDIGGDVCYYVFKDGGVEHIMNIGERTGYNKSVVQEKSVQYFSYSDSWLATDGMYKNNVQKIRLYSDYTEEELFQMSLVLDNFEYYGMLVIAYAKEQNLPSFKLAYKSLEYYEQFIPRE